jgi:16S rRNA (guanine527-N7)-methyltransferase
MAKARPPGRIDTPQAFAKAFAVSRGTLDRLHTYDRLLRQWQKAVNLVAPGTLDEIWHRHFADSAQLVALAPPGARTWLDLGSGAGFPGLVVAIMLAERNTGQMTLIESDQRKAAFLGEVARKTGVPVDIHAARAENTATQTKVAAVDVVTARALAPLPRLLRLAAPYFGPRTTGLFLKGRDVESELEEARAAWSFVCELEPSLTDSEGRIAVIRKLHPRTEG